MSAAGGHAEAVSRIRRETDRLTAVFSGWSEEEWARPTFCEGWTRRHIVAHLEAGADFHENTVLNGLRDVTSPPYGAADLAAFRAQRGARMKELLALPPAELVEAFRAEHHAFADLMERLRTGEMVKPCWHRIGIVPAGDFAGMRLYELALHDWDVHAAEEPAAPLRGDLLPALARFLPSLQWHFLVNIPASPPPEGAVRFECPGQEGWGFRTEGGAILRADAAPPSALIRGEAEALILMSTGRLKWRDALSAGRVSLGGDQGRAEALLSSLSGPY